MFKNLQPGFPVYVLVKSEKMPQYFQGNVTSVSKPHYDQHATLGQYPMTAPMVVDVTVDYGGKSETFTVDEHAAYNSGPTISLACDPMAIANEVRAIKKQSDDIAASKPYHESVSAECDSILKALLPQYAESSAQNDRIEKLEQAVMGMARFMERLEQSLPSLTTKQKE